MGHCNVGRLKIVSRNTQEGDESFYYNRFVFVNVHG